MTTKCDKKLTFEECELTILRSAIDKNEKLMKYKEVNKPEVKEMITIVEDFIRDKELICYGGTAINNILPKTHLHPMRIICHGNIIPQQYCPPRIVSYNNDIHARR